MQKRSFVFLRASFLFFVSAALPAVAAEIPPELRIKPEPVYEFAQKPVVTRVGDQVTVRFASKGLCDVTVAVEDASGRIVRHLACGVLGPNAPEPLARNAKEQSLVWDGKNDKGEYVDDKDALTVRVSLGLQARYEKSLYWEPHKRVSAGGAGAAWTEDPLPAPAADGVYLYDGNGIDHVLFFDHDGNYVRTVYPFPAAKLKDVKGLEWRDYPHGYARPKKNGLNQTSFLNAGGQNTKEFLLPSACSMAVHGDRIALAKLTLNRLATDGGTGGLELSGPKTHFNLFLDRAWDPSKISRFETRCCPYSAAFSPDGKRLYLAGFNCASSARHKFGKEWLPGVGVLDYDGREDAKVFTGSLKVDEGLTPGVACDSQGRVYVSDYCGDCINVYQPDAKLIRTLPVSKPTLLAVSPKSGEIYVFSWCLGGYIWGINEKLKQAGSKPIPPTLTILKSLEDPKPVATYPLPRVAAAVGQHSGMWGDTKGGTQVRAAVDFWTEPPTIWLVPEGGRNFDPYADGIPIEFRSASWENSGVILVQAKGGKLEVARDFGKETADAVKRARVNNGHQRLFVNPANRKLYVTEPDPGCGVGGGQFKSLLEINPESGACKEIPLPLDSAAEDLAFDIDGRVYLRQINPQRVMRYDLASWREIPWDYGEEGKDGTRPVISALPLPAKSTVCMSEGGLWVSPRGHLAVSCSTGPKGEDPLAGLRRKWEMTEAGKPYDPPVFPGRIFSSLTACVHVWDEHGKLIIEDAVPGMSQVDGLAIDRDDNVYGMSCIPRVYDGQRYFNWLTGTLFKARPGKTKWLSALAGAPVPLPAGDRPKRSPDISGYTMGDTWIEGVDWLYGGVGDCSFKIAPGCICWQQSRFTLDYFARSFAPEMDQFSVAVLDAAGNLILRIGQYGNVDDGVPAAGVKGGARKPGALQVAPPSPRPLGGDEVALMHACHVATLTDRTLFIGDIGNSRIVQAKLGYRAEEKVALKDVKNTP
jgi:DNA-binding beta-propeller fold protein YncE